MLLKGFVKIRKYSKVTFDYLYCKALRPEFKTYQQQVVKNAQVMAETLMSLGYHIVSNGTDTHLMLLDLRNTG